MLHSRVTSRPSPHTQLEARIDRHQEVARELLREGRRDRALLALKKKKLTENQLTALSTHIINVEGMVRVTVFMRQLAPFECRFLGL